VCIPKGPRARQPAGAGAPGTLTSQLWTAHTRSYNRLSARNGQSSARTGTTGRDGRVVKHASILRPLGYNKGLTQRPPGLSPGRRRWGQPSPLEPYSGRLRTLMEGISASSLTSSSKGCMAFPLSIR